MIKTVQDINKFCGGIVMEEYLKERVTYCRRMIDQYANQKGAEAKEKWSYWAGQLVAWQQALEQIKYG